MCVWEGSGKTHQVSFLIADDKIVMFILLLFKCSFIYFYGILVLLSCWCQKIVATLTVTFLFYPDYFAFFFF